jgi:internalin A
MPDGPPAQLNLWDFGGQDLYHGTHALFMRTRALFLLVWTPESESGSQEHGGLHFQNRPRPYWLDYIRHLGGAGSPLLLIQNRCDGGRGERANLPVDPALLTPFERDGRLLRRVAYSAADDSGRAGLQEALQLAVLALRQAQGQPTLGRNRLAVWEQLRAWRDSDATRPEEGERRHRLVPYADFEAQCRAEAIHDPASFAQVLHHAGMVWYSPGLFGDRMILDQSWALREIYALFSRGGGVFEALRGSLGGRFTRPLLDLLLWGRAGLSPADQGLLLDLMVESGICFIHRRGDWDPDATEYVAPELLPGREALDPVLAAHWDPLPGEAEEASFAFPFLAPGLARGVLSELGGLAGDSALYWRFGLALYDQATRAWAQVEEVPEPEGYGGAIRIRAKGAGAAALVDNLAERVARLNDRHGWSGRRLPPLPGDRGPAPDPRPWRHPGDLELPPLVPGPAPAAPPARPEVFISYAWERERQAPLVDALCASLAGQGIQVLREQGQLRYGDSIAEFMGRLSAGRCVLVILSAAYLRSPFCMAELLGIWRKAGQDPAGVTGRLVPLVQEDIAIRTLPERAAHRRHWVEQQGILNAEFQGLTPSEVMAQVGPQAYREWQVINEAVSQAIPMLTAINDVLVPRATEALVADNFAVVRDLIERALGPDPE